MNAKAYFCLFVAGAGWLATHTLDGAVIAAMVSAAVIFIVETAAESIGAARWGQDWRKS